MDKTVTLQSHRHTGISVNNTQVKEVGRFMYLSGELNKFIWETGAEINIKIVLNFTKLKKKYYGAEGSQYHAKHLNNSVYFKQS
jgi:hypothetical protein